MPFRARHMSRMPPDMADVAVAQFDQVARDRLRRLVIVDPYVERVGGLKPARARHHRDARGGEFGMDGLEFGNRRRQDDAFDAGVGAAARTPGWRLDAPPPAPPADDTA